MDLTNGIYTLSYADGSEQEAEYLHHLTYRGHTYVALNTLPEEDEEAGGATIIMEVKENGEMDEVTEDSLLDILEEKFIAALQEAYGDDFEVV